MTQKTPAEIEIENFKGCEKEDTPRIEKTEQEKFKENNQHKINNDEGDSCLSASTDRKPEKLDSVDIANPVMETTSQGESVTPSGFSTPNEEIIEKIKEYLALERWGKGQNNDRLIELFEKALSLQRQENENKYTSLNLKDVEEIAKPIIKEKLASLQEKIEKVFPELSYCKNFKSIETEEDFLMWLNTYNKIRKEEISKIFKEMGQ